MRFIKLTFIFLLSISGLICCSQKTKHKHTNALVNESSTYLLQHAHNPVNWFPWNTKYLEKAKKENKLVLLSIGYSSCHWCHVMEKETFEDIEVANYMNENFINIKIDREEHPDVDKTYMTAVQLMTGNGGWPLNCVILPDGKPIWGGTYFTKDDWLTKLKQISSFVKENPTQAENFAEELTQNLKSLQSTDKNSSEQQFTAENLEQIVNKWESKFDVEHGGTIGKTKFPKPNTYQFLLRYAYQTENKELLDFTTKTLDNIALGGLNDVVEGGFSRYTVDNKWHVPHFEKMLYDNAQLISLFSFGYQVTKKELYKEAVYSTIDFLTSEFYTDGLYLSSLNADSPNDLGKEEEGAYYTWKKEDLQQLLKEDYELFADYFSIGKTETVENKYVLIRLINDADFAKKHNLDLQIVKEKYITWKSILLKERKKRIKPTLDSKVLTAWNALLIQGFVDAYKVFGDENFKLKAIETGEQLKKQAITKDFSLLRSVGKQHKKIDGYLEDYALLTNAYISLYQVTLDETWLTTAQKLTDYVFENFYDEEHQYFEYRNRKKSALIASNFELDDAVIPSSNSVMCKNLFYLGNYFGNADYLTLSKNMLHHLTPKIEKYPNYYTNWLDAYANHAFPYYETVISGKNAIAKTKELYQQQYIPYALTCGSTKESSLPLLQNRFIDGKTLIYVCVNKSCKLPTESVETALGLMNKQ